MNNNQKVAALKRETLRLLERIKEYEEGQKEEYPNPRLFAAVKRVLLDLNVVGAKVRRFV